MLKFSSLKINLKITCFTDWSSVCNNNIFIIYWEHLTFDGAQPLYYEEIKAGFLIVIVVVVTSTAANASAHFAIAIAFTSGNINMIAILST